MRVNSLITHLQLKKMSVIYESGHVTITFQYLEMSSITTPNQLISNILARYIFQGVFLGKKSAILPICIMKLEDLKVLRRSPDLLNNVKIGQGQLQLIMKQILFYHILGLEPFWSSDLNNPMNTPSNSPVISEEKMFR